MEVVLVYLIILNNFLDLLQCLFQIMNWSRKYISTLKVLNKQNSLLKKWYVYLLLVGNFYHNNSITIGVFVH